MEKEAVTLVRTIVSGVIREIVCNKEVGPAVVSKV